MYVNSGLWRKSLLPLQISKKSKKISYEHHRNFLLSQIVKISHDYGLVSVRIFYKNNLIFFVLSTRILLKGKLRFIKLLWKKTRHLVMQIYRISRCTEFPGQFILEFLEILVTDVMGLQCNISSSTAKFLI